MFTESHTSLAVISLDSLYCCLDSEHRDHFWIGWRQTWHQEVPEFIGLLKGLLCLTPPLLLLLLHNADDLNRSQERKDLVFKLSFQMAIDLFDVIDMIDIVLDDIGRANEPQSLPADVIATLIKTLKETLPSFTLNTTGILTSELNKSLAILPVFGRVMIGVACFSLMLSIWQWAENKHSTNDTGIQFRTAVPRNVLEVIFVNFFFLIILEWFFFKVRPRRLCFYSQEFHRNFGNSRSLSIAFNHVCKSM